MPASECVAPESLAEPHADSSAGVNGATSSQIAEHRGIASMAEWNTIRRF